MKEDNKAAAAAVQMSNEELVELKKKAEMYEKSKKRSIEFSKIRERKRSLICEKAAKHRECPHCKKMLPPIEVTKDEVLKDLKERPSLKE